MKIRTVQLKQTTADGAKRAALDYLATRFVGGPLPAFRIAIMRVADAAEVAVFLTFKDPSPTTAYVR